MQPANSLEHYRPGLIFHIEIRVMVIIQSVRFALLNLGLKIEHNLLVSRMNDSRYLKPT